MQGLLNQILSVFMGFFAIMNPIANTPIFIGLTSDDDSKTQKKIALKSLFISFIIIFVCCIAGKLIFDLFGLTLPALRIAGGILVFIIGFNMLHGEQSAIHSPSEEDKQKSLEAKLGVAVSPLAIPILAGPGTIATAMNFSAQGGFLYTVITICSFAVLCVITYFFFVSGEKLIEFIGESAIKVITRIMGLILAVIGIQMLIQGIHGAINSFK